jgi:hypothetical protein
MLIITGQLRSIKDGRSRRILPDRVEAYVQDRAKPSAQRCTFLCAIRHAVNCSMLFTEALWLERHGSEVRDRTSAREPVCQAAPRPHG